jgi:hypothetical protein
MRAYPVLVVPPGRDHRPGVTQYKEANMGERESGRDPAMDRHKCSPLPLIPTQLLVKPIRLRIHTNWD